MSTCVSLTTLKYLTVWIITNCGELSKRWEYQTIFPVSLETLYVDQEATVRTLSGTTDWFKIEKGVWQGCQLSPCLFNLYAEYIMRNAILNAKKSNRFYNILKTLKTMSTNVQSPFKSGRTWQIPVVLVFLLQVKENNASF